MSSDGVGDFLAADTGPAGLSWVADGVRGLIGAAVTFEFQALEETNGRAVSSAQRGDAARDGRGTHGRAAGVNARLVVELGAAARARLDTRAPVGATGGSGDRSLDPNFSWPDDRRAASVVAVVPTLEA